MLNSNHPCEPSLELSFSSSLNKCLQKLHKWFLNHHPKRLTLLLLSKLFLHCLPSPILIQDGSEVLRHSTASQMHPHQVDFVFNSPLVLTFSPVHQPHFVLFLWHQKYLCPLLTQYLVNSPFLTRLQLPGTHSKKIPICDRTPHFRLCSLSIHNFPPHGFLNKKSIQSKVVIPQAPLDLIKFLEVLVFKEFGQADHDPEIVLGTGNRYLSQLTSPSYLKLTPYSQ